MSEDKMYLQEGFFKFLVSLEELKDKKERLIFISSVGISEERFLDFANYLQSFDLKVDFDENFVYPFQCNQKINLELNMSEWFALQASMQNQESVRPYFVKLVKNKVEEIQKANYRFNLYRSLTKEEQWEAQSVPDLIKKIDHAIVSKELLKVNFHSEKYCEMYPMRMVYLDGILCIVGEDVGDMSLCYFAIDDIKNIDQITKEFVPNISQIEINDFVSHLRLVNGNEERLILKIYSPGEQDLLPKYHHLGNPFVTTNPEGDMIWAASIEMCEAVYQWLFEMRHQVEILDPGHTRKEFAHFCELKKEINQKKAS